MSASPHNQSKGSRLDHSQHMKSTGHWCTRASWADSNAPTESMQVRRSFGISPGPPIAATGKAERNGPCPDGMGGPKTTHVRNKERGFLRIERLPQEEGRR
jgi:hypothetical protein